MNSIIVVQENESVQETLQRLEEEDDFVHEQDDARNAEWVKNFERFAQLGLASVAVEKKAQELPIRRTTPRSKVVAHLLNQNAQIANINFTVVAGPKKPQVELEPVQPTMKAKRRAYVKKRVVEQVPTVPTSPISLLDDSIEEQEYQFNDDVQQTYAIVEYAQTVEQELPSEEQECQLNELAYDHVYTEQVLHFEHSLYYSDNAQYITDLDHVFGVDSDYSQTTNEYSVEDDAVVYVPVLGDAY